jgi:hypothetical protein
LHHRALRAHAMMAHGRAPGRFAVTPSWSDRSAVSDPPETDVALRLTPYALCGALAMTVVLVGAVLGGSTFTSTLPGAWFFGPVQPSSASSLAGAQNPAVLPPLWAVAVVYGGMIVVVRTWLRFWRAVRARPGTPVRRVVVVIAMWALPLLLAPPLFSRDAYSYAGQGEMVSHQIDPYRYGTGVLGGTPFNTLAGPLWANTPSPYGPTFLAVDGVTTDAARHDELADLVLLRLIEVGGVVLMLWAIPALARSAGRDPAQAVALGVGCPLVLTSLIGGAHNDALMVGLMLAGLAVARRTGPVWGVMLCALAAGVKVPAALAIAFIGWNWAPATASIAQRAGRLLAAGAIGLGTLAAVAWASGLGWGWLRTFGAADRIVTGVTPVVEVARAFTGLAYLAHLSLSLGTARTGVAVMALTCVGVLGLWLLYRSPTLGIEIALGTVLLALALCSPILWAWYLTWGVCTLAPVVAGRLRLAVIGLSIGGTFMGLAAVKSVLLAVVHANLLPATGLVLVLCLVALLPLPGTSRGLGEPLVTWQPLGLPGRARVS